MVTTLTQRESIALHLASFFAAVAQVAARCLEYKASWGYAVECHVCGAWLGDSNTHPISDEVGYCIECAEAIMVQERLAEFFVAVAQIAEQRVAAKKAAAEAKKQAALTIIGRAQFKATGAVLVGIEDHRGKQSAIYHVTIIAGKITGCHNAATGEECSGRRWSGHCCHETRVLSYELAREVQLADAAAIAPALLGEQFAGDLPAHIDDELRGQDDPIDAERAAWAKMSPDERRAAYSAAFDLSYGDAA